METTGLTLNMLIPVCFVSAKRLQSDHEEGPAIGTVSGPTSNSKLCGET